MSLSVKNFDHIRNTNKRQRLVKIQDFQSARTMSSQGKIKSLKDCDEEVETFASLLVAESGLSTLVC